MIRKRVQTSVAFFICLIIMIIVGCDLLEPDSKEHNFTAPADVSPDNLSMFLSNDDVNAAILAKAEDMYDRKEGNCSCKEWVRTVVQEAVYINIPSNYLGGGDYYKAKWEDDVHVEMVTQATYSCPVFSFLKPGQIIQMRLAPPDDLHTAIIASVNETSMCWYDSNWHLDCEPDSHCIDISWWDKVEAYTVYQIVNASDSCLIPNVVSGCSSPSAPDLIILGDVDYIPLVPPGTWQESQNSGQVAAMTVVNYKVDNWYTRHAPNEIPLQIGYSNDWLADHYWECVTWGGIQYCYRDDNGAPVDLGQLEAMIEGHWGRNATSTTGATEEDIYNQLNNNKPVIVRLRKNMTTYEDFAWMVIMGMRPENFGSGEPGGIWVNDPSDPSGSQKWYHIETFRASWNASARWAVFVD